MSGRNRRFAFRPLPTAFAVAVLAAALARPVGASIITLNTVADANSNGDDAGAYGLDVTSGNAVVIDFDLSGLPEGATIDGATLSFDVYGYTPSGVSTRLTAFPKSSGAVTSGDFTAGGYTIVGDDAMTFGYQTVNLDATELASAMTESNLGIRFDFISGGIGQIASLENAASSYSTTPPTLNITAEVPEPASFGLLTAGGLALLARRRR
jgi:hypothetical protein